MTGESFPPGKQLANPTVFATNMQLQVQLTHNVSVILLS